MGVKFRTRVLEGACAFLQLFILLIMTGGMILLAYMAVASDLGVIPQLMFALTSIFMFTAVKTLGRDAIESFRSTNRSRSRKTT